MLWVLKRTVSMRRFFRAPKTYVKIDGKENIYNFTLKSFVYLNMCTTYYRITNNAAVRHEMNKIGLGISSV